MAISAQSLKANELVLDNVVDPNLRGRMIDYACVHYKNDAASMLGAMNNALSNMYVSEADAAANLKGAFKTAEAHMVQGLSYVNVTQSRKKPDLRSK